MESETRMADQAMAAEAAYGATEQARTAFGAFEQPGVANGTNQQMAAGAQQQAYGVPNQQAAYGSPSRRMAAYSALNQQMAENGAVEQAGNMQPPRKEVSLKFGKGLVGEPFISKAGKELVEVKIPNANPNDHRHWETFVTSPKMIHENQFGKGVWMKLPEDGTTKLSRSVECGRDDNGKSIWKTETRTVTNKELKGLVESYKQKTRGSVLDDLADKREQTAAVARTAPQREPRQMAAAR